MERRQPHPSPPPDFEIKVQSRRGGENVVHPVGTRPLPPPPRPQSQPSTTAAAAANGRSSQEFRPFKRWFPWLVPSFVVANILLFVITMYINNCPKNSVTCVAKFLGRFSFQPFKENPLLGPSSSTLEKMGALEVQRVVLRHQAWRLITCIWLHAGVFHILANMLSLIFIGIRLEQEFGFVHKERRQELGTCVKLLILSKMYLCTIGAGSVAPLMIECDAYVRREDFTIVRIGFLYVISGFGGSLMSALFIQSNISVGASGALFGLLGGMLSELITNWTIYENKLAALLTLVIIIIINLVVGILPHVDNFAHIGGFLSGFLLGFVFLIRPQFGWVSQRNAPPGSIVSSAKPKHKKYQYVLWVISLVLVIVGLTIGLVMLLRGVNANDHCSWCHYMSCVPTSLWNCKSQKEYCQSIQTGTQLNLTCISNGRSKIYLLADDNDSQVQQLCSQLCS